MIRTVLFVSLAASAIGCAQPLSRGERDRAMSELHATRKRFLDAIDGVSAAQWKFKPSPEAWSVAEIADHVVVSEGALFEQLRTKILASPAQPAKRGSTKGKDEEIVKVFPDRAQKRQAPEFLVPQGRWAARAAAAAEFRRLRDAAIVYVNTTPEDLRAHFIENRVMGEIDGYQYLLLIAAHTERHVRQIEEVKTHAKYPKK